MTSLLATPSAAPPWRQPVSAYLSRPGTAVVVAAASKDTNAKVTLLVFLSGDAAPSLAIKIPTTDLAESVVEREGRMLVELRRLRLRQLERTLPRFAAVLDADGRTAVAASVVPGVPMFSSYHSWGHTAARERVTADFRAAGRWLAELQRETASGRSPISLLQGVSDMLAARWRNDDRLPGVRRLLGEVEARLSAVHTPRCVSHGDYWCGNLLLTEGKVSGVVDWECARLAGEPLRDVARFPLSYALYLDRHTRPGHRVRGHRRLRAGTRGGPVRYAMDGAGWFPRLFRSFLIEHLDRLGVPSALWRDVAVAGIADIAASADLFDFADLHFGLLSQLSSVPPGTADG